MKNRRAVGAGIGALLVVGAVYLYKRYKRNKVIVQGQRDEAYEEARAEGLRAQALADSKEAKAKETAHAAAQKTVQEYNLRQKMGFGDVELYHPMFSNFFGTMDAIDSDNFIHSYLTIKRALATRYNQYDFECRMSSVTGALKYALEKKFDRYHKDRILLGETARLIKEEINKLVESPSQDYLVASQEIEEALVRGEGPEIFQGKFS